MKKCPICGRKFYPCVTCLGLIGSFSWRTVVCSSECFKLYMIEKIKMEELENGK